MNQTFFINMRGSAILDAICLWTLPFAGILLILNNSMWTYFGLVGGGMYLYFVGHTISSYFTMQRHGIRICISKKFKLKYLILILWGLIAFATIIMAVVKLNL